MKITINELKQVITKVLSEVSEKQKNQPYNTKVTFDDKIYITRNKTSVPPLSQGAVDNAVKYEDISEQNLTSINEDKPSFKEIMSRIEQEKERVKIEKERKAELIRQRIRDRNTPERNAERLEKERLKKEKEDEDRALYLRDRADDYYNKSRGETMSPGYQELLRKRAEEEERKRRKEKAKQMDDEYNQFIKKIRDEQQAEKEKMNRRTMMVNNPVPKKY